MLLKIAANVTKHLFICIWATITLFYPFDPGTKSQHLHYNFYEN